MGGLQGFHLGFGILGVIGSLSRRSPSATNTSHESGMVHLESQSIVWSVGMSKGDGSNPKWGRNGYSMGRVLSLTWCRSLGYGDLRFEYMRLGLCGSQGNIQSERMHLAYALEKMSVFTAGSHWTGICISSGVPMFEFRYAELSR